MSEEKREEEIAASMNSEERPDLQDYLPNLHLLKLSVTSF